MSSKEARTAAVGAAASLLAGSGFMRKERGFDSWADDVARLAAEIDAKAGAWIDAGQPQAAEPSRPGAFAGQHRD